MSDNRKKYELSAIERDNLMDQFRKHHDKEPAQTESFAKTNEEIHEKFMKDVNDEFNEFFFDGAFVGTESPVEFFDPEAIQEANAHGAIEIVRVEKEDEKEHGKREDKQGRLSLEEMIETMNHDRFIFTKSENEDKKESAGRETYGTVLDPRPKTNQDYKKPASAHRFESAATKTNGNNGFKSSPSSPTWGGGSKKELQKDRDAVNGMEDIPRVMENIQKMAGQDVRGWNEKGKGGFDFYETNKIKRAWSKIKRFGRSKKGRIMGKVGVMLGMQMCMASLTKRYEFENAGQASLYFVFLMGTFFMTRELHEEGFDARGLGLM